MQSDLISFYTVIYDIFSDTNGKWYIAEILGKYINIGEGMYRISLYIKDNMFDLCGVHEGGGGGD